LLATLRVLRFTVTVCAAADTDVLDDTASLANTTPITINIAQNALIKFFIPSPFSKYFNYYRTSSDKLELII
jgi:hypothetical protein